jgi:hypothetical protein
MRPPGSTRRRHEAAHKPPYLENSAIGSQPMAKTKPFRWKLVDNNGFDFGFYPSYAVAMDVVRAVASTLTVYRLDDQWWLYDPSVYCSDETPPHVKEIGRRLHVNDRALELPDIGGITHVETSPFFALMSFPYHIHQQNLKNIFSVNCRFSELKVNVSHISFQSTDPRSPGVYHGCCR